MASNDHVVQAMQSRAASHPLPATMTIYSLYIYDR